MATDFTSIKAFPQTIDINGVTFSGDALVIFIDAITNPDPERWYRFERQGDVVAVETKKQETFAFQGD